MERKKISYQGSDSFISYEYSDVLINLSIDAII